MKMNITRKIFKNAAVVGGKKQLQQQQQRKPPKTIEQMILAKLMDQVGDISNAELERILKQLKK